MKRILFLSLGSRGDMEPFLALGEALSQQGHTVGFCLPAQFESLAKQVSPHFYPQSEKFLELLELPEVKAIMGQVGSIWRRFSGFRSLTQKVRSVQELLLTDQEKACELFQADELIFHVKCIYPVFWGIHFGKKVSLLSPTPCVLQPVKHEPHIGFGKPRGTLWNTFTYWLAEYVLIYKSILGYGKPFLKEKQWTLSAQRIRKFFREELSIQYSVAETLFPRPDYWPERAQMIGFRERSKLPHFPVEKGLIDFLKIAPNPIYISFGSMVNARPKQIGEDLLSIAKKHNLSFIINTSWGGIELPESIPDGVYCVSDVPYDYLFPKVLAVLHHGGSGTTHSAWICGKSQAIIPHLGDQFLWNRCLNTQGIGISGFPIKEWTYAKAEALLLQLREHAIHKGEKRHVKG